ncbi:MAG: hypothetical protein EZS28_014210, partial [Streblomastix strix]
MQFPTDEAGRLNLLQTWLSTEHDKLEITAELCDFCIKCLYSAKDVQMMSLCMIFDILKRSPQNIPFNMLQQRIIFENFSPKLKLLLQNPRSKNYQRMYLLLEQAQSMKFYNLIMDLHDNDLILETYETLLSIPNEQNAGACSGHLATIISSLIENSEEISSDLMNILLTSLAKVRDEQSNIYASAVVQDIFLRCALQLQRPLSQFFKTMVFDPLRTYENRIKELEEAQEAEENMEEDKDNGHQEGEQKLQGKQKAKQKQMDIEPQKNKTKQKIKPQPFEVEDIYFELIETLHCAAPISLVYVYAHIEAAMRSPFHLNRLPFIKLAIRLVCQSSQQETQSSSSSLYQLSLNAKTVTDLESNAPQLINTLIGRFQDASEIIRLLCCESAAAIVKAKPQSLFNPIIIQIVLRVEDLNTSVRSSAICSLILIILDHPFDIPTDPSLKSSTSSPYSSQQSTPSTTPSRGLAHHPISISSQNSEVYSAVRTCITRLRDRKIVVRHDAAVSLSLLFLHFFNTGAFDNFMPMPLTNIPSFGLQNTFRSEFDDKLQNSDLVCASTLEAEEVLRKYRKQFIAIPSEIMKMALRWDSISFSMYLIEDCYLPLGTSAELRAWNLLRLYVLLDTDGRDSLFNFIRIRKKIIDTFINYLIMKKQIMTTTHREQSDQQEKYKIALQSYFSSLLNYFKLIQPLQSNSVGSDSTQSKGASKGLKGHLSPLPLTDTLSIIDDALNSDICDEWLELINGCTKPGKSNIQLRAEAASVSSSIIASLNEFEEEKNEKQKDKKKSASVSPTSFNAAAVVELVRWSCFFLCTSDALSGLIRIIAGLSEYAGSEFMFTSSLQQIMESFDEQDVLQNRKWGQRDNIQRGYNFEMEKISNRKVKEDKMIIDLDDENDDQDSILSPQNKKKRNRKEINEDDNIDKHFINEANHFSTICSVDEILQISNNRDEINIGKSKEIIKSPKARKPNLDEKQKGKKKKRKTKGKDDSEEIDSEQEIEAQGQKRRRLNDSVDEQVADSFAFQQIKYSDKNQGFQIKNLMEKDDDDNESSSNQFNLKYQQSAKIAIRNGMELFSHILCNFPLLLEGIRQEEDNEENENISDNLSSVIGNAIHLVHQCSVNSNPVSLSNEAEIKSIPNSLNKDNMDNNKNNKFLQELCFLSQAEKQYPSLMLCSPYDHSSDEKDIPIIQPGGKQDYQQPFTSFLLE